MRRTASAFCALLILATAAGAQTRRPVPAPLPRETVSVRGFGDLGLESFQASESFTAVFGKRSGLLFGGGLDVLAPHGIFAEVRASRFRSTGERVFVFDNQVFPLGESDTVTVTPLEVSAGYRFFRRGAIVPFVGGGAGWYRYDESSAFSTSADDVSKTSMGYHVLGGAEVPLWRWLGAVGEVQWSTVPNALGQDPNGVSAAFHETNLGGLTARVKITIGR